MPSDKRFVVDSMLGKLAKWLRILGFDTRYEHLKEASQVDRFRDQGFLLITRNQRWCNQPQVLCITANNVEEQLREVVAEIPIVPQEIHLLERCVICNENLEAVNRSDAAGRVPDYVFESISTFHRCPRCRRFFWSGSHPKRMHERLTSILGWSF